MKHYPLALMTAGALLVCAPPAWAGDKTTVISETQLQWKDMGAPGLVAAPVSGDMDKGPSRFFLKYPVGFVTPPHHHSADHRVVLVSGKVTLTVNGKSQTLGPGSYFALAGKPAHVAKVEGDQPALFYIESDGPWDVVMQKEKK